MKIAYRIITPIFSIGAVVMGFFLKLFYFKIAGASEEITSILQLVETYAPSFGFEFKTDYQFSVYEIIQMFTGKELSTGDPEVFLNIVEPIFNYLVAFVVFFVVAIILFLITGLVAAITCNRKAVIGMSASGLVICLVCIVVSRFAFDIIKDGQISLADVVGEVSDSALAPLLANFISISQATLSGAFFGIFGMYIVVIIWSILANMLIKTPIQIEKKHRRKKPLKSVKAIFRR